MQMIESMDRGSGLNNILPPLYFDMLDSGPLPTELNSIAEQVDLVYAINLCHISPWGASLGLFRAAAALVICNISSDLSSYLHCP